jgi:predicted ribosome quality control (RQC) complex YloA/Tae2 family protein
MWQARGSREYELDDIMLLKVGRHIRPKPNFKIIVGREEGENRYLEGYRQTFISVHATSHSGPLALIDGDVDSNDIDLAARIVTRYGQGKTAEEVTVEVRLPDGSKTERSVAPLLAQEIEKSWHV